MYKYGQELGRTRAVSPAKVQEFMRQSATAASQQHSQLQLVQEFPVSGLLKSILHIYGRLRSNWKTCEHRLWTVQMSNELSRLELWASELDIKVIDEALSTSNGIKVMILRRLCDVAWLILRAINYAPSHSIYQQELTKELKLKIAKYTSLLEEEDSTSEQSDDSVSSTQIERFSMTKQTDIPRRLKSQTTRLIEVTPYVHSAIDRLGKSSPQTAVTEESRPLKIARSHETPQTDAHQHVRDQLNEADVSSPEPEVSPIAPSARPPSSNSVKANIKEVTVEAVARGEAYGPTKRKLQATSFTEKDLIPKGHLYSSEDLPDLSPYDFGSQGDGRSLPSFVNPSATRVFSAGGYRHYTESLVISCKENDRHQSVDATIDILLSVSLISRSFVDDLGSKIKKCNEVTARDTTNRFYSSSAFTKLSWHTERGAQWFEEDFYIVEELFPPVMLTRSVVSENTSSSGLPLHEHGQPTSPPYRHRGLNRLDVGSLMIDDSSKKPQCWEHGCNGRTFSTFTNLLRHQREKAGTSSKSFCPYCHAEFSRKTARDAHIAHDKCKSRGSKKMSTVDQGL